MIPGRPPRPSRPAARALLALAVALVAAGPARADDEVRTEHVVARGDVGRPALEAYAALGEACYPQWKAYFKAEPKADRLPLVMDVRSDRAAWVRALAAVGVRDGPGLGAAGGYYDAGSRVSFLYLQPHDSSTRLLVIHELTHQYQYKAVLADRSELSPLWHREGLAEHFGYHRRTAGGVDLGAYDVVAIDTRPVEVAARVAKGAFDPWGIGTGKVPNPDYTDALGLVGLLLRTGDGALRRAYARFEQDLLRGGDPGSKFERDFAGLKPRLEAAAREVWGGFRRTWEITYIAWDEEPGAIVGRGLPWAFLHGNAPLVPGAAFVEATIRLSREAVAGGVALGSRGPDDLVAADVRADRRVLVRVKRGGTWWDLGAVPLPFAPADRAVRVRLEARGTDLLIDVDGARALEIPGSASGLTMRDVTGVAGLMAESGVARFADVKVSDADSAGGR